MKNKLDIYQNDNLIVKQFYDRIAFDREIQVYTVMADTIFLPDVFEISDMSIKIAKIAGQTYADIAITGDKSTIICAFEKLAYSLYDFEKLYYQKCGRKIAINDFNPRNFLYTGQKAVFIDFEDSDDRTDAINWPLLLAMVNNCHFSALEIKYEVYNRLVNIISDKYGIAKADVVKQAETAIKSAEEKRKIYRQTNKIDGFIIAGGNSIRMGGVPKGLLHLGEYSFCQHLIHSLRCFDVISISANLPEYQQFRLPVVQDTYIDIGPISAIYNSLLTTEKEWVFLVPCDMPFISEKIIHFAIKQCDFSKDAIIFCCKGREYPTLGFYNKRILEKVYSRINARNYKLKILLSELDCQYIEIPFPDVMVNINTPVEYNKAIEYHNKTKSLD